METLERNTNRPGRKPGVPLAYCNEPLLRAFYSNRDLNVTRLCRELGISRQTFYAILRGGVFVTREKVESVATALRAEISQIFP